MPIRYRISPIFSAFLAAVGLAVPAFSAECGSWQVRHPEWIFCDDFESTGSLVAAGRYFEQDNNKGDFQAKDGTGWKGSRGMRALWQAGEVEAGNLKLAFGRVPGSYFAKGIRDKEDFREIYYRMYVRTQVGWEGDPYKLSRATVMAKADWSQAMIAHVWGDQAERLKVDPARCVDASGAVTCAGYNDFNHLQWIGARAGATKPFTGANAGKWMCIEAHVRLNDAGKRNGVHEFWIDDKLEAKRDSLDFVGSYKEYGLNGVFFENHWNSGSPKAQERFFDNIVVSTRRVTCADGGIAPTGVEIRQSGSSIRPAAPVLTLDSHGNPQVRGLNGPRSLTGRALAPVP
jgi:hypothetical protein